MKSFREFINEAKDLSRLDNPSREGYYVVDIENNDWLGPWDLNPRGFELAKKNKTKELKTVLMFHKNLVTNKFTWSEVRRDGGPII